LVKYFLRIHKKTFTRLIRAGTSTNGPITAAKAWPEFMPPLPSGYSLGSEEEAIICADLLQCAWDTVPDALDWLEENIA